MPTFLFDELVFGPVQSRRLGISLGVNLLPTDSKFCNFNCIYCECGWTTHDVQPTLPSREAVRKALTHRLHAMRLRDEKLDVITFAGNGEPTIHPEFPAIINDTIATRDELYPEALVVVLSNATMLERPQVANALRRVDQAVLKLDAADDDTLKRIDGPQMPLTVNKLVQRLKAFGTEYTLQTLFLQGEYEGQHVNNASEEAVAAWLKIVEYLRPRDVMIYTIDRATPAAGLKKVPIERLNAIAAHVEALGITTQVRG